MEYLTVDEVTLLKGCSGSYISRQIKSHKLEAEMQYNPATKQMRYMIPLTALPDHLQEKWYKKQRTAGFNQTINRHSHTHDIIAVISRNKFWFSLVEPQGFFHMESVPQSCELAAYT